MASLQRTHYENLGVARDAPLAHIKQAYYAAVLKYHPDKATAVSNTARAQEQPAEGDEPCGAAELDGDLVASTSKVFELVQKAWEVGAGTGWQWGMRDPCPSGPRRVSTATRTTNARPQSWPHASTMHDSGLTGHPTVHGSHGRYALGPLNSDLRARAVTTIAQVLRDAGRRAAYDSELSLQELQAPLSYQDELDLGELDEEVDAGRLAGRGPSPARFGHTAGQTGSGLAWLPAWACCLGTPVKGGVGGIGLGAFGAGLGGLGPPIWLMLSCICQSGRAWHPRLDTSARLVVWTRTAAHLFANDSLAHSNGRQLR